MSKEAQLGQLLTTTIQARLAQENLIPDVGEKTDQLLAGSAAAEVPPVVQEQVVAYQEPAAPLEAQALPPAPAQTPKPTARAVAPIIIHQVSELQSPLVQEFDARYQGEGDKPPFPNAGARAYFLSCAHPEGRTGHLPIDDTSSAQRFPTLRYIGQLQGTFLLAQASDGLYIVDQHAAKSGSTMNASGAKSGRLARISRAF